MVLGRSGRWAISIHAPRVGSDTMKKSDLEKLAISIHAPRVGSDPGRPELGFR